MRYFTSDLHLGHENIIKFSNRPFTSGLGRPLLDFMHDTLAGNWDGVITKDDEIYVLGDVAFDFDLGTTWLKARPGKKTFVRGNHDPKPGSKHWKEWEKIFEGRMFDYLEVKHGGQLIVMSHYPILEWNRGHLGSWMLHGHTHGNLVYPHPNWRIADVGVDVWNYMPVSYLTLAKHMEGREDIKHHNRGGGM